MTDPGPEALTAPPSARASVAGGALRGLGGSYWKLWAASVVSNLGDGVSAVAYPWLAAVLTRDPVLIAAVGVAQRLPWLLFSLPGGALVDRSDRRRLMMAANALRAVLTAAVAAAVAGNAMTLPLLYSATLVMGFAEVLYDNAAQTILPSVVERSRLERANGTLWGAEMVLNQFVGPPLGGFLVAAGLALPFGFDAVTFALSAVLVGLIAGGFRARSTGVSEAGAATVSRRSLRSEIAQGLRWLWRHRLLRTLAVTLGVMNGAFAAALATQVLFAQEILDLGAQGFGLLLVAGGVGGVVGSQLAPAVTRLLGSGGSLYLTLVGGGLSLAGIGAVSQPLAVGALMAVGSFLAVVWNVTTVSLRQTIIPDDLLGRVNSVYRFFGWGSMPVGAFAGGLLVSAGTELGGREFGLRLPFLVAGALHLAVLPFVGRTLSSRSIDAAKAAADHR